MKYGSVPEVESPCNGDCPSKNILVESDNRVVRFDSRDVFSAGSQRTDNNLFVTVILMLNYMVGSGILNQGQVFKESGIAAASVLYIIAGFTVWMGFVALIQGSKRASASGGVGRPLELGYAEVAHVTLGRKGALTVDWAIVISNFGNSCSYVVVIGSLTVSLLAEWTGGWQSFWTSFYFVAPVFMAVFVLPVCLVRHFSNLRWVAAFSVLAITAVAFLVLFGGPLYAVAEGIYDEDSGVDTTLCWWSWWGSLRKIGSVVFSMTAAPATFHAYSSMSERTEWAWKQVSTWSVLAGGSACYIMGLVGYLSFRDATNGDILENFHGVTAGFFKALVVLHLMLYIPNELVIMRHSLYALASKDVMEAPFVPVFLVTVSMLVSIVGLVLLLVATGIAEGELFGYLLDIFGGIAASITNFVLPGLIYIHANKERGPYHYQCVALSIFGVVVLVTVLVAVIVDIALL